MKRQAFLVVVIGAAIIQVLVLWRFYAFTAEDAYIVARYSENLVDRGELVFNPGERVNALTAPLHCLIEVSLYLATGSTIASNKLFSVLLVLGTTLASLWQLRRHEGQVWLFIGLVIPSPFLALWTVGGLETPYLLALVTAVTLIVRRSGRNPTFRSCVLISLLLGLCFLTRFDAVLFAAPIVAYLLIRSPRRAGATILPGLALAIAWMGFAWGYFHDVLPTSFYVKTPSFDRYTIKANVIYLAQFLILTGCAPVALWAFISDLRHSRGTARPARNYLAQTWWLPASIFLVLAYALTAGTKHMMFSYRLLVPYLPTLVIALLDWIRVEREGREEPGGNRRWCGTAAGALVLIHLALAYVVDARSLNPGLMSEYRLESRTNYVRDFTRVLKVSSGEAAEHWRKQAARQARAPRLWTFAAGIVPYNFREAYVFEELVSYRKRCRPDIRLSADYLHVLTPRHGAVARHLPGPPASFELVSSHPIEFDGSEEHFLIFFNRHPLENPLPPRVDGECRDVGDQALEGRSADALAARRPGEPTSVAIWKQGRPETHGYHLSWGSPVCHAHLRAGADHARPSFALPGTPLSGNSPERCP